MTASVLLPRDLAILELEGKHPRHTVRKEEEIAERLGVSAVRYYQLLSRLLDHPAALAHDPLLVRRLRRMRDADRARRAPLAPAAIA